MTCGTGHSGNKAGAWAVMTRWTQQLVEHAVGRAVVANGARRGCNSLRLRAEKAARALLRLNRAASVAECSERAVQAHCGTSGRRMRAWGTQHVLRSALVDAKAAGRALGGKQGCRGRAKCSDWALQTHGNTRSYIRRVKRARQARLAFRARNCAVADGYVTQRTGRGIYGTSIGTVVARRTRLAHDRRVRAHIRRE